MTKFFKKNIYIFLGQFGTILLKFGQKWTFVEIRALPVFKYSSYLPLCEKSEKN